MNRRNFISASVIGSAASLLASRSVLAAPASTPSSQMAGGLYYTKASPGRWAEKATGHSPLINIKVTTPHEMKGYEHYIVKHIVLDKDYNFITEKVFDPAKDKAPISEHDLGAYKGEVNVLSVCNLHDTWLSVATV